MTHCDRVLALLADGQPHSHHELYALGCIAHSRVSELRRRGHLITVCRCVGSDGEVDYLYRLLPASGPSFTQSPVLHDDSIKERFLAKLSVSPAGCWLWTANINPGGYPMFSFTSKIGRPAHRVAWELFNGPIPEGKDLDHLCRNKPCVNPWHLEPVTPAENKRRDYAAKETCRRGRHTATPENLYVDPRGGLHCRPCMTDKQRAYEQRRRTGSPLSQSAPLSPPRAHRDAGDGMEPLPGGGADWLSDQLTLTGVA